jgi:hypothetical protein
MAATRSSSSIEIVRPAGGLCVNGALTTPVTSDAAGAAIAKNCSIRFYLAAMRSCFDATV